MSIVHEILQGTNAWKHRSAGIGEPMSGKKWVTTHLDAQAE
jgi:hypothetical protein